MTTEHAVQCFATVEEFLTATEPWLLTAEADNNLLFSVACVLTTNDHPFHGPVYFAAVKQGEDVVGCALSAPPDGLEVGDLPAGAAAMLVDSVAALRPDLSSVSGGRTAVLEFAQAWAAKRGGGWRVQYEGMLFRLDDVEPPQAAAGRLRLATEQDTDLLDGWATRYARAIDTHVDVAALFARMRRRGMLHLWDDGGPKCAVGESGTTPNGTRINAVYTPDEFRNRGYASNAVAAVSAGALARGNRFCVLFAEPKPGRIYERLGYKPVREHLIVELRRPRALNSGTYSRT